MSVEGMAGLRVTTDDVLGVLRPLSDDEWTAPSAAAGWSVKDVAAHLADLLGILMAAVRGDVLDTDLGIERLNDLHVSEKADWPPDDVLRDFTRRSAEALTVFGSLQNEPYASTRAPYLDLGTYPLHTMADLCAFDFHDHLRWDVLAPRGPLRSRLPQPDEVRLRPAVNWLLAGLPNMQPGLVDSLAGPIRLRLTGPGGGESMLDPGRGRITVTRATADPPAAATVESTAHDFTGWATTRLPWRERTTVTGDHEVADHFLDALNLV
ncbi:maleylpyruvate isomerase N-terminal domain-containing protein [Kitasatospora sp. NPDC052896]|uniref:maleylpyruvate isomerase N-terminal domain-containing protein n=1 Tax=Kitasatospora sp. NPDC052896 TaxID=3364061 RepID=UPI0037C8D609